MSNEIITGESTIRAFRRSLRSLEREIELAITAETECCGVSVAQCHLLLELDARGPSSICDLAAALALDQSTLSRTADSLVKAGLATRSEDPSNRRRQILELSSEGAKKARSINHDSDALYESLFAEPGSPDCKAAAETVAFLVRALRKTRTEKACCAKRSR
jgi:DNA-binding MarR family transcriptional regulator